MYPRRCWRDWFRSEERRGGKEGRSRWAPYYLKKKNKQRGNRHTRRNPVTQAQRSRESPAAPGVVDRSCCGPVSAEVFYLNIFFFFFSSRRRHTRCLSDWSSDVCSSD